MSIPYYISLGTGDSDLSPVLLIVLAFTLQNTNFLHCREVAFNGALTHRQSLRHLFAGDCRRFFDEIEDFLLTLSKFRFRHGLRYSGRRKRQR